MVASHLVDFLGPGGDDVSLHLFRKRRDLRGCAHCDFAALYDCDEFGSTLFGDRCALIRPIAVKLQEGQAANRH